MTIQISAPSGAVFSRFIAQAAMDAGHNILLDLRRQLNPDLRAWLSAGRSLDWETVFRDRIKQSVHSIRTIVEGYQWRLDYVCTGLVHKQHSKGEGLVLQVLPLELECLGDTYCVDEAKKFARNRWLLPVLVSDLGIQVEVLRDRSALN